MKLPKDKVQVDNRRMSRSKFMETHFRESEGKISQRKGQRSSTGM